MNKWTLWRRNPIAAAYEVADANGIDRRTIDDVLLSVPGWDAIGSEYFLDDLLQEIAGSTDIIVQYDKDEGLFRATLDSGA